MLFRSTSIISLPEFNESFEDLYLELYSYSTSLGNTLKVGIVEEIYDLSTFIMIDSIEVGLVWLPQTIDLSSYSGSGYITIIFDGLTYKRTGTVYLDQFKVISTNDCRYQIQSELKNITSNSADIEWQTNGFSATVKLFTTPINTSDIESNTTAIFDSLVSNNNSCTFTSLVPDTRYYAYVRGICSNGDTTIWVENAFTTECNAFVISNTQSYSENFDNYGSGRDANLDRSEERRVGKECLCLRRSWWAPCLQNNNTFT